LCHGNITGLRRESLLVATVYTRLAAFHVPFLRLVWGTQCGVSLGIGMEKQLR